MRLLRRQQWFHALGRDVRLRVGTGDFPGVSWLTLGLALGLLPWLLSLLLSGLLFGLLPLFGWSIGHGLGPR